MIANDGGSPTDRRNADDSLASRDVPPDEAEAALDYWTPERMQNATPG